jgi:hypothetical protein
MKSTFVKFKVDLHCDWTKTPPPYRLYVNDELFTERTYIWGGTQYLQEIISLSAPPGRYSLRIDNLGDSDCKFKLRNLSVETGPATVLDSKTVEITQ